MRLSSRTRYGVRALFDLAYHGGGRAVLARDVAGRQDIPLRFLEQVFLDLKRAGIVSARRGRGGGYFLAKPATEVRLGDVLRAVEGPLDFGRCIHSHDGEMGPDQHVTGRCVTGQIWQQTGDLLRAHLDSITVNDLCDQASELGIVRAVALPGADAAATGAGPEARA
jgi:Rrf2 family protein